MAEPPRRGPADRICRVGPKIVIIAIASFVRARLQKRALIWPALADRRRRPCSFASTRRARYANRSRCSRRQRVESSRASKVAANRRSDLYGPLQTRAQSTQGKTPVDRIDGEKVSHTNITADGARVPPTAGSKGAYTRMITNR